MTKTVLITGGNINLGATISETFAQKKYNIVISYHIHEKEANELVTYLKDKYNVNILALKADISKEKSVKNLITKTIQEFNKIDILINNASISLDNDFFAKSAQEFKSVLEVNLVGTFLVSKYVAEVMLAQKTGVIINISSTNGIDTPNPYSLDYDASKAGIISLTHNFAKALSPYIRVNTVAPGWINTTNVLQMNPNIIKEETDKILLGRFAQKTEIAKVVLFLASEDASYINDTIIRVDGGLK